MKILKALCIVAAMAAAVPTFAQSLGGGGCTSDLTLGGGSTLVNCFGRYSGNTLSNNSGDNTLNNNALTALGYGGAPIAYNTIPGTNILTPLNGNTVVNFPGLLNGDVYFAVHYGGGQGGPGNSTTFYRINAQNLDVITLNLRASSTAALFVQSASAVPEPATWAMLLTGFGAIGFAVRRKQRQPRIRFA